MSTQTRGRELTRAPLTLEDLTADLLWPRLLRAASLAFQPSRLGMAFFAVVLLALISQLVGAIAHQRGEGAQRAATPGELAGDAVGQLIYALSQWSAGSVAASLYYLFVAAPAQALTTFPVATIVGVTLALLVWAVAGGAISRMAACEFSLGMSVSWPQGLGFALGRLGSLVGALVGPVAVVWILALLVALGGLLLRIPVLNVVGGLLFGVALVLGLIAVLVMIAFVVGKPMLIPAVACDGADAIDAIQRAYAYVFGRPLRLAVYLLVLLLEALAIFFIVQVVVFGIQYFAMTSASALAGESGNAVLAGVTAPDTQTAEALGGLGAAAAWLIRIWLIILGGLLLAYAISFYFCASTLLYLAMRRITDGQDMHELWLPGMVSGTTAEEGVGGRPIAAPEPASPPPPASQGGWVQ